MEKNQFYWDDMPTFLFNGIYDKKVFFNHYYRNPYLTFASINRLKKYVDFELEITKDFNIIVNGKLEKSIIFETQLFFPVHNLIEWNEVEIR